MTQTTTAPTITEQDAQMVAQLWDYALTEPDQPAANPVTMWFEQYGGSQTIEAVLQALAPGEWTHSIPTHEVDMGHGVTEVEYTPAATSECGRTWYIATIERGDASPRQVLLGLRAAPIHDDGGPYLLALHHNDVNDARGISYRLGLLEDARPIDLSQAARMLDLSPRTLRNQAALGRLAAERIETERGPVWMTTRAAVERYRREHLGKHGNRFGGNHG